MQYAVCSLHYAVCSILYAVCSVQCALYTIQYTLCSVQSQEYNQDTFDHLVILVIIQEWYYNIYNFNLYPFGLGGDII